MRNPTAASRLALWKAAAVAGVFAASVALVGGASAAVFTVIPPAGSTAQNNGTLLANAINSANSSTDASSTIVLATGAYAPTSPLPAITKNLRITGDHASQLSPTNGGTGISGGSLNPLDQTLVTINAGAALTLEAVTIRTQGVNGGATDAVVDNGTVTMYGAAIQANLGPNQLLVNTGATATINDSLVSDNAGGGAIDIEGGTVNLNNSNVTFNQSGGITNNGTLNVTNSILSNNDPGSIGFTNCTSVAATSDHSLSSDASCGFTDTGSKNSTAAGLSPTNKNGGPINTQKEAATSPAIGAGDALKCPIVDGRFFTHTTAGCDMGSYQSGGAQDTTPPSCTVTGVITGPPKQQQVTVQDTISGLGPEGGTFSDPTNGTNPVGNNQADAVDGLTITNGTVSATPFSSSGPSTTGVVLTATKTDQTMLTHWSFTATNWAGVTKFCT